MVRQSVLDCLLWLGWTQLVDLNCQRNGWDCHHSQHSSIRSVSAAEASLGELMVMWGLMVLAMMLPTFHAHARVHQDIRSKESWPSHTFVLVLGFLLIWSILVVVGAVFQRIGGQ